MVANNLQILRKCNQKGITKVKIPLREEVPNLIEIENHKKLLNFDDKSHPNKTSSLYPIDFDLNGDNSNPTNH